MCTGPLPPQLVEAKKVMLKQFQKMMPDLKGEIQPEESVRMQLKVIDRLDADMSGSFLSHHGVRNRW